MALIFNKRIQTEYQISPPILSFTSQPQDTIIDYNGSATLTSVAVAVNPSTSTNTSGTFTYQWYKNNSQISGANSSNLTLSNQIAAASYYCIANFTPASGVAPAINAPITSRTATTTIRIYISITTQPVAKQITEGQTASFNIAAVASNGDNASLRYEWVLNGNSIKTTTGGTFSSVDTSPGPGSYSIFCKVSQGGVPGAVQAPSLNSSTVSLIVDAKPLAQCLVWDDPIRPGGKQSNIVTASGDKPSLEEIWYGVWVIGTEKDTCRIQFSIEIKNIVPRSGFRDTWEPFSVEFELNIGSNDRYRVYKVLDWNGQGTNANSSDRKNLDFNTNNVDGNTNVWYGENNIELFRRTNDSKTKWKSDYSGDGLYWDPTWGKAQIYIRVGKAKRKRDGATINWFARVETTKTDNVLEYSRRYDPNIDIPENRSVTEQTSVSTQPVRPAAIIQYTHQKSESANYDRSEVANIALNSWTNTTASTAYGSGNPPSGNGAVSFGVGQWEIVAPDRDIEVAIEMSGAAGQGSSGFNNSFKSGGQGGVGVIYLKLLKGNTYTLSIGRSGPAILPNLSRGTNYPNENSSGGGWSGSEQNANNGNGGGGTFVYKGGRIIAAAGGGGGCGKGAAIVNSSDTTPAVAGGNGGGPGQSGSDGDGGNGGTGASTSGPGNNKITSAYNRDTRSNNIDAWMRYGECSSWIAGSNSGVCDCSYNNINVTFAYSDSTSPKRQIIGSPTQSCDSMGKTNNLPVGFGGRNDGGNAKQERSVENNNTYYAAGGGGGGGYYGGGGANLGGGGGGGSGIAREDASVAKSQQGGNSGEGFVRIWLNETADGSRANWTQNPLTR